MSFPFPLWRSLRSGGGGEIREKIGRGVLGSMKGSRSRMWGTVQGGPVGLWAPNCTW